MGRHVVPRGFDLGSRRGQIRGSWAPNVPAGLEKLLRTGINFVCLSFFPSNDQCYVHLQLLLRPTIQSLNL